MRMLSVIGELVLDRVDALAAGAGIATQRRLIRLKKIRDATVQAARLQLEKQLKKAEDEKGDGDRPKTTADLETWDWIDWFAVVCP